MIIVVSSSFEPFGCMAGCEMSRRRLGAEIAFMQLSVPTDRAERSPKGVGSIEFDRRSASGAYETQSAHLAAR